jgi:K(+)-stimulated pyrophosphate-energized sodium pump
LLEGKEGAEADYEKCIQISTKAALREMMAPGIITITVPAVLGFIFGAEVLGGYLAGITVSGVLLAIFQSNAGGAWDNAKKSFEKGIEINGQVYYKGSEPHKAAVTGDTVGDPFKDTSGPSMNILIKLSCIVALIIAPNIHNPFINTSPAATTATVQMDCPAGAMPKCCSMSGMKMSSCNDGKTVAINASHSDSSCCDKGMTKDCCKDKSKAKE